MTADGLKPGDVLKGTYRVVKFLGEGGAGAVYQGEHIGLGHAVAVKTLFGKFVRDDQMRRRFVEEGVIQANLNHVNIVRVNDIVDEPRLVAIIMEFVGGSSLDRYIRKQPEQPDIAKMSRIFLQILEGMGHAHTHGIVHRDLKPANILLGGSEDVPVPKIADFGIAKVVSDFTRTETGTAMGTIYYASPEQLTNAKAVDHRADVYSLACTYYEMLTWQLPFVGDSLYGIMRAHIQAPRPDASATNPGVPRPLANVIRRAMDADPQLRPQSCEAFAKQVRDALGAVSVVGDVRVTGKAAPARPVSRASAPLPTPAPDAPEPSTKITRAAATPGAPAPRTNAPTRPNTAAPRASAPLPAAPATSEAGPPSVTSAPTTVDARATSGPGRVTRSSLMATALGAAVPEEARTAGVVVQGAILGLSVALIGLLVFAVTRGGEDEAQATPTATASTAGETVAVAPREGSTGTPPVAPPVDEPPARLSMQQRLDRCRHLTTSYIDFDPFGNVPIGQAISELEENHVACTQLLLERAGDSRFDRLVADLNGYQMRVVLYGLRATRAQAGDGDACTEALLGATEAQRSLRRIRDAESGASLLDYEISSLVSRREFALERHAEFRTAYDDCAVPPLPPDLDPNATGPKPEGTEPGVVPGVDEPELAPDDPRRLNPQIVHIEHIGPDGPATPP